MPALLTVAIPEPEHEDGESFVADASCRSPCEEFRICTPTSRAGDVDVDVSASSLIIPAKPGKCFPSLSGGDSCDEACSTAAPTDPEDTDPLLRERLAEVIMRQDAEILKLRSELENLKVNASTGSSTESLAGELSAKIRAKLQKELDAMQWPSAKVRSPSPGLRNLPPLPRTPKTARGATVVASPVSPKKPKGTGASTPRARCPTSSAASPHRQPEATRGSQQPHALRGSSPGCPGFGSSRPSDRGIGATSPVKSSPVGASSPGRRSSGHRSPGSASRRLGLDARPASPDRALRQQSGSESRPAPGSPRAGCHMKFSPRSVSPEALPSGARSPREGPRFSPRSLSAEAARTGSPRPGGHRKSPTHSPSASPGRGSPLTRCTSAGRTYHFTPGSSESSPSRAAGRAIRSPDSSAGKATESPAQGPSTPSPKPPSCLKKKAEPQPSVTPSPSSPRQASAYLRAHFADAPHPTRSLPCPRSAEEAPASAQIYHLRGGSAALPVGCPIATANPSTMVPMRARIAVASCARPLGSGTVYFREHIEAPRQYTCGPICLQSRQPANFVPANAVGAGGPASPAFVPIAGPVMAARTSL
mmetsp:Transcript_60150/g.130452  ORF Transcript_60150/g.130452 Transcript_60150/m.130452 type:complete len:591 (+) Transcript_60150:40-1812(+)